jgi:hypothetical protein
MESNSKNSKNNNSDNQLCPTFTQSSAADYLLWNVQWRSFMRYYSLEEYIITEGKIKEFDADIVLKNEPPDLLRIICKNQNLVAEIEGEKENFDLLFESYPWIPYWLRGKPYPLDAFRPEFPRIDDPSNKFQPLPGVNEIASVVRYLPYGHLMRGNPNADAIIRTYYPGITNSIIIGDAQSPVLNKFEIAVLIRELKKIKVRELSLDYEEEKAKFTDYDPGDPLANPPVPETLQWKEAELMENKLSLTTQSKVKDEYNSAAVEWQKGQNRVEKRNKECQIIFSKLNSTARNMIHYELANSDYHGAYNRINAHFINKGIADIIKFENAARSIKFKKGDEVSVHINKVQEALQRWAIVKDLEQQSKERGAGVLIKYSINVETANANAYDASDEYLREKKIKIIIDESTRFDIYEKSFQDSTRFQHVLDEYSTLPSHQKSVSNFLQKIYNFDVSRSGQDKFAAELSEIKDNEESNDQHQNKKVKTSANITKNNDNKSDDKKGKNKVYPKGSCKNHPNATSHTTANCLKKNSDKPENNSNKKNSNSNSFSSDFDDTKSCSYCRANPKFERFSHNHTRRQCRLDPRGPSYVPYDSSSNPKKRSFPSSQHSNSTSTSNNENSNNTYPPAMVNKMANILQKLTKNLKKVEDEDDDST